MEEDSVSSQSCDLQEQIAKNFLKIGLRDKSASRAVILLQPLASDERLPRSGGGGIRCEKSRAGADARGHMTSASQTHRADSGSNCETNAASQTGSGD